MKNFEKRIRENSHRGAKAMAALANVECELTAVAGEDRKLYEDIQKEIAALEDLAAKTQGRGEHYAAVARRVREV